MGNGTFICGAAFQLVNKPHTTTCPIRNYHFPFVLFKALAQTNQVDQNSLAEAAYEKSTELRAKFASPRQVRIGEVDLLI